ncbi:tetratricopeptide repeat protein [Candidatus Odyssella thessalonicensis]|uniref:tetratricopeptide repeat protein n=1 Tax=Candidatus Odyssella thessalonicensis TaxID=84647 RepID=UPI000302A20E|nr:hypothetical protein [Candidatus Odyssella thessalonicensis]
MSVWAENPTSEEAIRESIEKQIAALNAPPPPSKNQKKALPEEETADQLKAASPPKEQAKVEANFSLEHTDGMLKAKIEFINGVPFYAVFSHDGVWHIALSYPTNNTFSPWQASEFPELTSIDTLSNESGFCYRLHLTPGLYPKIAFDDDQNTLTVTFDKQPAEEGEAVHLVQPRKLQDAFRVKLRNAQTDVEFYDPDTGEVLWVICADEHNKPIPAYHYPEFDLLDSYQGLAFLLRDETLDYSYIRKVAEIRKDGGLANSLATANTGEPLKSAIFSTFKADTAPQATQKLLRNLATDHSKIKDGLHLLWLYSGQGLGLEAADMAEQLLNQASDLKILPFWRSLSGLAALLRFRYPKAQEQLEFVQNEPDADFWKSIALAAQQAYSQTPNLKKLTDYSSLLSGLPLVLKERLRNDILEVGVLTQDPSLLKTYGTNMSEPVYAKYRRLYEVAKAVLNLDPSKDSSAEVLKDLANINPSSKTSVLAMLNYLKFMHKAEKIKPEEELAQLDHLRYLWRGDQLEYTLDKYLALRYMEEKRYAEVLPLLRKTLKYFTKQAHQDKLPDQMQQALINYFNQESPPVLEMLSIFQDYMSIAPDDARGDAIMIKVTNILANLELYEEAISLLKEYLNQKIQQGSDVQERKNKIYYRIAVASILAKKPQACLDNLGQIKNPDSELQDDLDILKAESYLMLKQKDKALDALGETPAQLFHKANIFVGDKNWAEAIKVYEKICSNMPSVPDHLKEQSIINLALCYLLTDDQKALTALKSQFGSFMEKRKGAQTFEFLTSPNAQVSLTHLASLQQVTSFAERLKNVFSDGK